MKTEELTEEQMLEANFTIPCINCEGYGYVWIDTSSYCFKSIGNCCGGCGHDEQCQQCDGTGTVEMTMQEIWDEHDSRYSDLDEDIEEIISWWDGDNTLEIYTKLKAWEQK